MLSMLFADVTSEESLSYTSEQSKINGTWSSIFKASDHGDEGKNIPIAEKQSRMIQNTITQIRRFMIIIRIMNFKEKD